jgi:hypothetical protein
LDNHSFLQDLFGTNSLYVVHQDSDELPDGLVFDTPLPPFTVPRAAVSGTAGADGSGSLRAVTGTTRHEVVQGGNNDDIISTGGGNDLVIGGYGDDTITLGAGDDVVLYRFESDASRNEWKATDGGDVINNFKYGEDRLVLVDVSTDGNPINNLAELIADNDDITVGVTFDHPNDRRDPDTGYATNSSITAIEFRFGVAGTADGSAQGSESGTKLTINFDPSKLPPNRFPIHPHNYDFYSEELIDLTYLSTIFRDLIEITTSDDLPAGLTIL